MRAMTGKIGRSDQCDISVKDGSMSGRHAEISKINGEIRVRDMGSANGIWLNGERVDDVELFDGDVLRLGQTSIRVDVVGGRKRPDAGLSPKVLAGIIAGVLVLAGAGIAGGLYLKKRAQTKRDRATLTAFIAAARESQKSKPCAAAVDKVGDVARTLNTLGRPSSANPPKGDEQLRQRGRPGIRPGQQGALLGSRPRHRGEDGAGSAGQLQPELRPGQKQRRGQAQGTRRCRRRRPGRVSLLPIWIVCALVAL